VAPWRVARCRHTQQHARATRGASVHRGHAFTPQKRPNPTKHMGLKMTEPSLSCSHAFVSLVQAYAPSTGRMRRVLAPSCVTAILPEYRKRVERTTSEYTPT